MVLASSGKLWDSVYGIGIHWQKLLLYVVVLTSSGRSILGLCGVVLNSSDINWNSGI